ncbi:hypothetical protein [Salinigranum sp. GCM10025319]|uniref:hypothetical protein n=1 Tax=Salinigranum sp. GCM10025319 TaxID=3252687 RepID=UPI00360D2946
MSRSDESERSVDDLLADVDRLTDESADGANPASTRSASTSGAKSTSTSNSESASKSTSEARSTGFVRSRLPSIGGRLGGLFSVRTFLLALALSVVAVVAGGSIPLLGVVGRLLGLFVVAFAVGLVGSERHYVEVGLAGAIASGAGFIVSTLTSVFFPFAVDLLSEYGVVVAGVGAGVGTLAALVGHYVGRDLRDGLTREL